jgi:hypothetical protein
MCVQEFDQDAEYDAPVAVEAGSEAETAQLMVLQHSHMCGEHEQRVEGVQQQEQAHLH